MVSSLLLLADIALESVADNGGLVEREQESEVEDEGEDEGEDEEDEGDDGDAVSFLLSF